MEKEKKTDVNAQEDGNTEDPKEIKGTDFVEPQGKVRKVIKWVLGGVALVASGIIGLVIGKNLKGDDEDGDGASTDTGSDNTTEG